MDINPIDNLAIPVQNKHGISPKHEATNEERKLKKAAQSFESFFIAMLFEKMQKTSGNKDGMFGKGTSGEIYSQLFNQALGDKLAAQNSLGLSKMMLTQLQKKEAVSTPKLLDIVGR